jgi:hypothetical protein
MMPLLSDANGPTTLKVLDAVRDHGLFSEFIKITCLTPRACTEEVAEIHRFSDLLRSSSTSVFESRGRFMSNPRADVCLTTLIALD